MIKKIFGLAFFLAPIVLSAQVAPSTRGGGLGLSVGAEYSNFKPDYGSTRLQGIAIFGDLDHIVFRNLGVEGEARWLNFNKPAGETISNYMAGPRYRAFRFHGLSLYGKFLLGGSWITYPNKIGSGSYFSYAPGVTGEYRLTHHWSVRGEYEYQFWPSAPGIAFTYPFPSRGLNPSGFSAGVSYRLF